MFYCHRIVSLLRKRVLEEPGMMAPSAISLSTTQAPQLELKGNGLVTPKQSQHHHEPAVNGNVDVVDDDTSEGVRTKTWNSLEEYKNPSLYVTPYHVVELKDTPIPTTPTASQVLVHVRATGICGSDLHLWHRGAIGPLTVDHSHVLGHEASGVVLRAGSAVAHLKPGDKVAIEPRVPCHTRFLCTAGKYYV